MTRPLRAAIRITAIYRRMLDSESVRLFVWPFYLALLAWGIYSTIWAWPSSVIEPVMGHEVYVLWSWMFIPGTLFVLVGLALRHGGKPLDEMGPVLLFGDYLGLFMQRGGHVCMGLLLFMYEFSIVKGGFWGQPLFSFFAISPYVLGCYFLAHQAHRKIRSGEVLHRKVKAAFQ
jgi:hypothetical protein